jgi:hypothetical protein
MLEIKDNFVQIPLSLWDELKNDLYFKELIEALEEKQELLIAEKETEYFVDYDEYRKKRLQNMNV